MDWSKTQPKITPEFAVEIYDKYASGNYTMADLAREYRVTRETISRTLNKRLHGLDKIRPPFPKGYKRSRVGTARLITGTRIANQARYYEMSDTTLDKLTSIAVYLRLGWSHRKIAEVLGMTQPNVTQHIRRYPEVMAIIEERLSHHINQPCAATP